MSLLLLLTFSILLFCLLRYVVLPRLESSVQADSLAGRVGKSSLLAGIKLVADLTWLAIGVYGAFGLIALVMASTFGHNATLLGGVVNLAEHGKSWLKPLQDRYSSFTFAFVVCVFLFLTWRQRRDAISGKTRLLYDLDEDRCNREREADPATWDALAPNELMLALDTEMQRLVAEMPKFAADRMHGERLTRARTLAILRERRIREDYARRIDHEGINKALRAAQRENPFNALISKGFYADLKFGSKLLARAATVLALVSLIGLGQAAGMNQLLNARLVRLDELRVEAQETKVKAEWDKGLAQSSAQEPMTADDKQAMAYLADQFARALLSNPAWQMQTVAASSERDARRVMSREAILERVSLPTSSGEMAPAYHANLSQEEREALDTAVPVKPYTTQLGEHLAETEGAQVKSWFGSHWGDVKKAAAAHKAAYYDPLQAADLRQDVMDKMISAILKKGAMSPGELETYVQKTGNAAKEEVLKTALHQMVPQEFHHMFEEYAEGVPLDDVFRHVHTARPSITEQHLRDVASVLYANHATEPTAMVSNLRDNPGGWPPTRDDVGPTPGSEPGPSSPTPTAEVSNIVDEISKSDASEYRNGSVSEQEIEGLAEYDDFFPKTEAAAKSTVLSQEIESHGGPSTASLGEDVAFRVQRAASFGMLEGFSRVGGVLIGREPDNPSKHLDLRGLDWTITGRQVTLRLQDANGKVTQLQPFDKSLVHQALAYAADGRPVAVTMTTAKPMESLKVQLHPALLDTPLGCRVSQLDRLVDTFAGYEVLSQRKELVNEVGLQLFVYDYAWAARLSNLDKFSDYKGSGLDKSVTATLRAKDDLSKGLVQQALFARDGVIRQKPAFFDPALVDAIKVCKTAGPSTFGNCVRARFSSVDLTKETVDLWLRRTAFIPWSGVRERPFSVNEDLSFLRPPDSSDPINRLWPFDFLIQVSFTTPAVNAPTANDRYVDQDPMEFKSLRTGLQKLVDEGIQKKGLSPSFEDLRNFAVLQRLFRLALHGNLGDQFPVTRLAALEHQTAGDIPYIHTARWQQSDVYAAATQLEVFELRLKMMNKTGSWAKAAGSESQACAGALESAILHVEVARLPACNMEASRRLAVSSCEISKDNDACRWALNPFKQEQLEGQLKVERAFGVLDDQKKKDLLSQRMPNNTGEGDGPCPPLQPTIAQGGRP